MTFSILTPPISLQLTNKSSINSIAILHIIKGLRKADLHTGFHARKKQLVEASIGRVEVNYSVWLELHSMAVCGKDGQRELESTATFMFAKWVKKNNKLLFIQN